MNARNTTTHNPPLYNWDSFRQGSSKIFTLGQQNFQHLGVGVLHGAWLVYILHFSCMRYICKTYATISTLIVMNAQNTTTHNPPHYNPNSFRQGSSTIFTLSQQNFQHIGGGLLITVSVRVFHCYSVFTTLLGCGS